MKPGRIELSSKMTTLELARALGGRGVLRVEEKSAYEKNGVKHVFLRERTNLEAIKDFFTFDAKTRAKPALAAHAALKSVLQDKVNAGQLLQNIQDRINHNGNFSGRSIARDLSDKNRSETGKVRALQGGTVVAESAGGRLNIMHKSPLEIQSAFTIVRASSLPANLHKHVPTDEASSMYKLTQDEGVPATNLVVFKDDYDIGDDKKSNNQLGIFAKNLNEVLKRAATEGSGVVIEVSPAMFGKNKNAGLGPRGRDYISTVVSAAKESLEVAKKNKKQMAVTFAGEDKAFLAVFNSQYEADRLGLNKAQKNKTNDQEDLSESDDDDNESPVLDKN